MLYGLECWTLSKADTRKIDTLDQWCLWRILNIWLYQHVSDVGKLRPMGCMPWA